MKVALGVIARVEDSRGKRLSPYGKSADGTEKKEQQ